MPDDQPKTTADQRNAAQEARENFGGSDALSVAQAIGTFTDDPPETHYQRAYLKELWAILKEKMP